MGGAGIGEFAVRETVCTMSASAHATETIIEFRATDPGVAKPRGAG